MTNGTKPKGALDGVRVLDLGRYQAGPRCGLMFARLGADVIKVEALKGDESRTNGPRVRGQSAYWVQYNSGKRSLSINLRTEEGKEVLRDLVKVSDVLIQNFRPGTIAKMGFGYNQNLKKILIPSYRSDILHQIDLVEDICIALCLYLAVNIDEVFKVTK